MATRRSTGDWWTTLDIRQDYPWQDYPDSLGFPLFPFYWISCSSFRQDYRPGRGDSEDISSAIVD